VKEMARIVSMAKVKKPGSCKVFTYKGKKRAICRGAIGILTPRQTSILVKKAYPATKRTKRVEKHWKKFEKIAKRCQRKSANLPRIKKGTAFRTCMLRETRKAGIKI
jgi:hypothetical protein